MNSSQHRNPGPRPGGALDSRLRLIWWSMLLSVIVYMILAVILRDQAALGDQWLAEAVNGGEPPLQTAQILGMVGVVISATMGLAVFILPSWLAGRVPRETQLIIRMAAGETPAIFGLVLALLGASSILSAGMMGWSLLLLVYSRP